MKPPKITDEVLRHEYLDLHKAMKTIAEEKGVSVGYVYNRVRMLGISRGRGLDEVSRARLSEALRGKPSAMKGKHLSPERIAHLSAIHKGAYRCPSKYGGHKKRRVDGYISVYAPDNQRATKDGYVMEHILVAEEKIGRRLEADEVVHHINRIRDDNRPENLAVMTASEHMSFHMRERHQKRKEAMTY